MYTVDGIFLPTIDFSELLLFFSPWLKRSILIFYIFCFYVPYRQHLPETKGRFPETKGRFFRSAIAVSDKKIYAL